MPVTAAAAVRVQSAERQRLALEYRKQGCTYQQIADRLGCGIKTAHKHVNQALARLREDCRETAEEVRTLELQKLDQMEARLVEQIEAFGAVPSKECHRAMELRLKVIQQRCKLLGLTAPPTQQVNVIAPPEARLEVVLNSPAVQQLAAAAVREAEIIDQTPTHDSGNG
ncbi:MAG: sigma factor-like helix-turn-helix DNA-binding protein [Gemmataceae bacterium]